MRHDDTARLRHMLAHASEAVQLASGRTHADELFGLAITRLLAVIGELAGGKGEKSNY